MDYYTREKDYVRLERQIVNQQTFFEALDRYTPENADADQYYNSFFLFREKKSQSQLEWEQRSAFFNSHFKCLQPENTAESSKAKSYNMNNKKNRKAFYSEQKTKAMKNEGVLTPDDIDKIEALRESEWGKRTWMKEVKKGSKFSQEELYQQALKGDFKDFEHLDEPLRNALASRWMRERFIMPIPNQTPGEYARAMAEKLGVEGLMHPLFRLGISLAMRSGLNGIPEKYFAELDSKCCSEIMAMTLSSQTALWKKNEIITEMAGNMDRKEAQETVEANILRDQASRIFIAKNLLLMHMSNFTLKKTGEPDSEWKYDVATAFGHCSRVAFILPALSNSDAEELKKHRDMWESLRELRSSPNIDSMKGNACGIFKRGASTHDFQRRKVNQRDGGGEFREIKRLANFLGQEGLNVAVGGLYEKGINKRRLLNDGSCGHIYFMKKEATLEENGGFLIGFESDAYQKTNQLGHKHGFGNGEFASSFGGQRVDEIGDKYGGRVCDLKEFTPESITSGLLKLEHFMRLAMTTGEDMAHVMSILAGKKMNKESLDIFFKMLDLRINDILDKHWNKGYSKDSENFDYRGAKS